MKSRIWICFLLIVSFTITAADADDLKSYSKIIKKHIGYPKDILYNIPAQLPDKSSSPKKNEEYMKVAEALVEAGDIMLERKDNQLRIEPKNNIEDTLQKIQDMQYKVIAFNVILGLLTVEVTSYKITGDLVLAEGNAIFKPSRIYNAVSKVLPQDVLTECSIRSLAWEINKTGDIVKVVEKPR